MGKSCLSIFLPGVFLALGGQSIGATLFTPQTISTETPVSGDAFKPDTVTPEGSRTGNKPAATPVKLKQTGYWHDTEIHLTIEGGIAANPWTTSGRNFGQFFLDRANTVTLNQIMGSVSHPVADVGSGYGIGFMVEMMYGSDARFDPTIGMADNALTGLYQFAPTQAHVDLHAPWLVHNGMDFQIGQFYGIMGAEGIPALARPFYSFNYASDYIVPFETIGILSTTHLNDHYNAILGIDAGNSTSFGRAGNNNKPKGYVGVSFTGLLADRLDGHLIGHFGPQSNNGAPVTSADGWTSAGLGSKANGLMQYNGDLLLTYHLSKTLSTTLNAIYLRDDATRNDSYGVTGYLAWDINPSVTLNLRGEIFRDNTGSIIASYASMTSFTNMLRNAPYPYFIAPPTTYGALTAGVTYRPDFINRHIRTGKLLFRPELRLDKSLNGTQPFNRAASVADPVIRDGTNNMFWFSCDAVWSF
ncbi:porin [Asaia spathodeae]|uniref:Outer membrane beta-barrel protein n=1 Tax=Asaia spathodeae TaxID=657016 RepID=A0ABX2P785_9PROT|nr:porin [Asaia spathodeae]GBR19065.1 hypothetical protein AA105894_2216 [Asaia spathodeae NBRC 105894]